MAHSLEVRVPYLDPVIADIALSLPSRSKSGNGAKGNPTLINTYRYTGAKKILIDAGRSLLLPDFDIQPKRGFTMPFDSWLNGPLNHVMSDALSETSVRNRGWLDTRAVQRVREEYASGNIPWVAPWLLMMIELWAREIVDG
jgi:asparagine synthase (glutamine-hydrolysing)